MRPPFPLILLPVIVESIPINETLGLLLDLNCRSIGVEVTAPRPARESEPSNDIVILSTEDNNYILTGNVLEMISYSFKKYLGL